MDYQAEEGVITFGQIWRVVKKSLARALIYVLVCAILSFAVLFTVKKVTAENTYSARITFSQSDSSIKTTLDNYKATATNNAISEVFGSSEDTTEIYEEVLKSLTITAYIPEEYDDDTSYVATSFIVSFEDVDISGVSAEQQKSLLDKICSEFISYYSEIKSTDMLSSSLAWGYTVSYNVEYMDILDEIGSRLSTLKTTMSANINANVAVNSKFSTYRSTDTNSNRRTAYEILAQLDNIDLTISNLEEMIYNNGITNTNAAINGSEYCAAKLISLQNSYDEYSTIAAVYEAQLENLSKIIQNSASGSSGSSSTTLISVDISEYTALSEKLISVEAQMASITTQMSKIKLLQENISSNDAENASNMVVIEGVIEDACEDILAIIEEYNDLVSEFEEQIMPSSYATVSKPAVANSSSIVSWSLLAIVVFAIVVIAYLVAFGQTWSAMKKAGTLDGDKPANKELLSRE